MHHLICIESDQYLPPTRCRLLSVLPEVAVPQPSEKIFRVDFMDDTNAVHIKWLGTCPNKCKIKALKLFDLKFSVSLCFLPFLFAVPCLLTKILKAIDEKLLTDLVLLKQIRALVEEWKKYVIEDHRVHMKFICKFLIDSRFVSSTVK